MLNPDTPFLLAQAAFDGNFHQMQKLLDAGTDINAAGSNGSALFFATENANVDVVNYLLSLGADPNIPFNEVYPIHNAIDIEVQISSNTAWHPEPLAIITYVLILAGADINSVSWGQTPLRLAHRLNHKQAVALLEARDAVAQSL